MDATFEALRLAIVRIAAGVEAEDKAEVLAGLADAETALGQGPPPPVGHEDLKISQVELVDAAGGAVSRAKPGDKLVVKYVVSNVGDWPITATYTQHIRITGEVFDKMLLSDSRQTDLSPGESRVYSRTVELPDPLPGGEYDVQVTGDVGRSIDDPNRENNAAATVLLVELPALPPPPPPDKPEPAIVFFNRVGTELVHVGDQFRVQWETANAERGMLTTSDGATAIELTGEALAAGTADITATAAGTGVVTLTIHGQEGTSPDTGAITVTVLEAPPPPPPPEVVLDFDVDPEVPEPEKPVQFTAVWREK